MKSKVLIINLTFLLLSNNLLAANRTGECFNQIPKNPNFESLTSKMIIGNDSEPPTDKMLQDTSKPSKEEQVLLIAWDQQRNQCIGEGLPVRQKFPKEVSNALDNGLYAQEKLVIELVLGNLTYGEYAKLRFNEKIKTMTLIRKLKKQTEFF